MNKLARFNGVCNFLAAHWKAGTYARFYDPSFISKDNMATRKLQKKIMNEANDAERALDYSWENPDMDVFIQALKRWAEVNLNIIEFMEIYSEMGGKNEQHYNCS